MQGKRAYKKGRTSVARFPLPASELRVLLELRRGAELSPGDLARLARLDLATLYVTVGRLRRAGLVTTKYLPGVNALGRHGKFADNRLTAHGKRLSDAFARFLQDLGPSLCSLLGWA